MGYYNDLFENSPRLAGSVVRKLRYSDNTKILLEVALNNFEIKQENRAARKVMPSDIIKLISN